VDFLPNVSVTTLAGSTVSGKLDGTGAAATFDNPVNLVVDANGNLTVADFESGSIRSVTPAGVVTTPFGGKAGFSRPFGLAYGPAGELFVETDSNTKDDNTPDTGSAWTVDLAAGTATLLVENVGRPRGLLLSGTRLLMSNPPHHAVRALDLGSHAVSDFVGTWDCAGFVNGTGTSARFYMPYDIAQAPNGDLIIADEGNNAIRRLTPDGVVSTIVGTGTPGMVDGTLAEAYLSAPRAVAVDAAGVIYVSELGNQRVRRIDIANDRVQTVAGDGNAGFMDGAGNVAEFFGQEGIDVSADGHTLYVADGTQGGAGKPYNRIRAIALP